MAAMSNTVMLVDQSLCVGCEACTTVCKAVYSVPKGIFRTQIDRRQSGFFPEVSTTYNKRACMHCEEAACVMACPTRACHKSPEGLTLIDKRLCIGCNYCIANCPYNSISFDRGANVAEKCTLCITRLRDGLNPLCVEVCTSRVISFGDRSDMLDRAEQRVTELRQQGYSNAQTYGGTELGGLRVISVLSDRPGEFGLPVDPSIPLGLRVWRMVPLTPAVIVAGGLVLGINYLRTRRLRGGGTESTETGE